MIGYQYFCYQTFPWRRLQQVLVPLAMPHVELKLTILQARRLLKEQRSLLLRWDEAFDQSVSSEWWHIIKDDAEDIYSLNKKTRNMVRRGAKQFDVRVCDRKYIALSGHNVYKSAFARYETFEKCFSESEFENAINKLPEDTEFWGVFDKESGQLVAFSENIVRDDACFYNTMWFEPEPMRRFSGYILFHEMNKHYLNERSCKYVSDGARSISHQTNIHEFLESKFGFRKAYSRLRVVYAPGIYPIIFCLYPFRRFFSRLSGQLFKKLTVLLEQERIRRACLD